MTPGSWQVGLRGMRVVLIVPQAVPIVLMLAGAIFFVVGVRLLVDSQRFLAKAATANGMVVDVAQVVRRERRGSNDHPYYVDVTYFHPVVRFVTVPEQIVQFQASEGSANPSDYRVGDSVRILYDPANPRNARLDTRFSRWGEDITVIAVGLCFVVIGAVIYRFTRPRGRAARRGIQQNPRPQEGERRVGRWLRRQVDHGDQGPGGGAGPPPAS